MNDEQRGLAPEPSPPVPAEPIEDPARRDDRVVATSPGALDVDVPGGELAARPLAAEAVDTLASAAPPAELGAAPPAGLAAPPAELGAAPLAAHAPVDAPALPDAPAAAATPYRADYRFLTVLTVLSLVADLATKAWAKWRLSGIDPRGVTPRKVEVVKDHLDFVYALNPGGAWSFLRGLPELVRRPFFLFISAAAIVFIVSVYRRVRPEQRAMRWGLPLALGGAIGNLVDRIRYGSVIDFIDFYVKSGGQERHWPTYNVADVAIVVGVALMAFDTMTAKHEHAPTPAGATAPTPAPAPQPPEGELAMPVPATPPAPGAPGQP
jgi:signal peptidase II